MRVWIDADACPKAAKDQVIKFALKRQFEVVLVAAQADVTEVSEFDHECPSGRCFNCEGHCIIAFMEVYGKRPRTLVWLADCSAWMANTAFLLKTACPRSRCPLSFAARFAGEHLERWQSG